ncbi:hypothetical protein [Acinetobacter bereziniae]|uniref:hypothetical protein n=1 Tax=Acinetobacter bereziniae TaxID=106648 RepID=UPI000C2B8718|nr:hypothetical protein [Acinetobacter bereziniae]ATZ65457.1 hypothetical protein BSR55_20075 [Acinetobacter bereziniae]
MELERDSYYYKLINSNRFSRDTDVKEGCLQLLDFLMLDNLDNESSFYFDDLRKHVEETIDNRDFIYSVFYLTRPEIDVLVQKFSVWDDRVSDYVLYENDIYIRELLRDKYLINPISGIELTPEEFEEQILTFFSPTDKFMERRYDVN